MKKETYRRPAVESLELSAPLSLLLQLSVEGEFEGWEIDGQDGEADF